MPILVSMKSAFFILFILFSYSSISKTYTVANQSGRLKTVNIIEHQGTEYSDFEYTTSCILDDYKYENNNITFGEKQLEAIIGENRLNYSVASQKVTQHLSDPILMFSNRVCVPILSYIHSLDTLGICKIISEDNGLFRIAEYNLGKKVPNIGNFSNKFNLAYFEQVYLDVKQKYQPKKKIFKKPIAPIKTKDDESLEVIKDALKDEKSETPEHKKDDYYDIPRGLNRDDALKKKKH